MSEEGGLFVLVINYLFSKQVKILSEKGGLFWKLFCFNDNSKYILLWTGGFLLVVLVSDQGFYNVKMVLII